MTAPNQMPGYYVWNPSGGAPTFRHDTLDLATAEASRLSAQAPGKTFIVLATVHCAFMPVPGPAIIDMVPVDSDRIPF